MYFKFERYLIEYAKSLNGCGSYGSFKSFLKKIVEDRKLKIDDLCTISIIFMNL